MRSKALGEVADGELFCRGQFIDDSRVEVGGTVSVNTAVKELENVGGEVQINR